MVRFALGLLSLALVAVLTVAASSHSNLENTLTAQQNVVAERPYDAAAHNDLGNLLVLGGRHQEAQDSYRRAIELDPTNTLPRFNLGVLLQQIGRSKEAVAEYRGLLEIDERHARAHYQLGMLHESRNRRNAALEHYAQAFAFDPELTFPRTNPHLIDNRLATEAMLMSRRFHDAPSSETPRLYGEPERIAELMLKQRESLPEPVSGPRAEQGTEPVSAESQDPSLQRDVEGEPEDDEEAQWDDGDDDEDDEDDEDSDDEAEGRRTLTREDLAVGSSVGQVRQSGGSAHSPTRQPAGSAAAPAARSGRDLSSGRTPRATTGRPPAASGPRYRPASRFSTGRLNLELLPSDPGQKAAT